MSEVFSIVIEPDGVWDHSRFPHPLITIDYDRNGKPIQVVTIGPIAKRLGAVVDEAVRRVA